MGRLRQLEIIENCELTTKSLPPDHFWTQELFAELVGSIVGILSGGADDILRITLTFYNARKISVGKFVEVSMGVFTQEQLHILLLLFKSSSKLLLLLFYIVIVQAHGKFVLVFWVSRLSCLVYPPTSGYVHLEFYGRKQAIQLFHTVMHTLVVSKSVVCEKS